MQPLYCFLSAIMFGIYLVADTQMIIGKGRYEINDDDYILGALILYMDMIQLFLYILKILAESEKRR